MRFEGGRKKKGKRFVGRTSAHGGSCSSIDGPEICDTLLAGSLSREEPLSKVFCQRRTTLVFSCCFNLKVPSCRCRCFAPQKYSVEMAQISPLFTASCRSVLSLEREKKICFRNLFLSFLDGSPAKDGFFHRSL